MSPLSHFPYGISSYGAAVLPGGSGGLTSLPNKNGSTWFVDTVNGSDGNQGNDPTQPFKTIGRALTAAGNGTGDTIYIYPGSYAETLTVSKDYISLVGATWAGYGKPDIESAAGITLTVTGQGFQARHCRFAGTLDVVVQQGNGFLYSDCVFDGDGNGATTALLRLLPSSTNTHLTASEGRVQGCLFRNSGGRGIAFDTGAAPVGVGSTDNVIDGCTFYGNTGTSITAEKTGAAGTYSLQTATISNCYFATKNKAVYIDFVTNIDGPAASQTGTIMNCYFAQTSTLTNVMIKVNGTGITVVGAIGTKGITDASGF